jgi:hypothetical protein
MLLKVLQNATCMHHFVVQARVKFYNDLCVYATKDVLEHSKRVFVMLCMLDTFVQYVIFFVAENDMLFQHFCCDQWEYVACVVFCYMDKFELLQSGFHDFSWPMKECCNRCCIYRKQYYTQRMCKVFPLKWTRWLLWCLIFPPFMPADSLRWPKMHFSSSSLYFHVKYTFFFASINIFVHKNFMTHSSFFYLRATFLVFC